ncbi:hypothetical protein [Sporanaerobacter acetigenes]|uniref:hypothetical protein n=1 Tax=Sporanaerobacter acetigenes TaxID=165813 RepID=UPI003325E4E6
MNLIYQFISLFTEDNLIVKNLNSKEDLYKASINYDINNYKNPDYESFLETFTSICEILDSYTLDLTFTTMNKNNDTTYVELNDKIFSSFSTNTKYLDDLYENIIKNKFEMISKDEFIRLEININKPMELESINRIFFFNSFIDSLSKKDLKYILVNSPIYNSLNYKKHIIFLIDEDITPFFSQNIYFLHDKKNLENISSLDLDYEHIVNNYKRNCHFINSNLNITPYTFKLIKRSQNEKINEIFDKLTTMISLIYISNYSELDGENILKVYINGYKLIEGMIDYCHSPKLPSSYFDIFEWVYRNEHIEEKLELARQIISLDYKENLYDINDKSLASIESNYLIYLKENVDSYISLKNQITEDILKLSLESRDIIKDFSSNFKNTFLANLSFVFTILILNIVSETSKPTNIFNRDLSILYLIIVIVSFLYLIFSIINTKKDLEHYNSTFNNLKELYSGLLSKDDLENTFNNSILTSDTEYIKKRIQFYSVFWLLTIIISLVGLYFLSQWFATEVSNTITYIKKL